MRLAISSDDAGKASNRGGLGNAPPPPKKKKKSPGRGPFAPLRTTMRPRPRENSALSRTQLLRCGNPGRGALGPRSLPSIKRHAAFPLPRLTQELKVRTIEFRGTPGTPLSFHSISAVLVLHEMALVLGLCPNTAQKGKDWQWPNHDTAGRGDIRPVGGMGPACKTRGLRVARSVDTERAQLQQPSGAYRSRAGPACARDWNAKKAFQRDSLLMA